MEFFAPYMDRITDLCRKHKVRSLYAFGSAAKGTMGPQSDVDLVVDIPIDDPFEFSRNYWTLEEAFQDLFHRPVDLLSLRAIKNKYFRQDLDAGKLKLYEA